MVRKLEVTAHDCRCELALCQHEWRAYGEKLPASCPRCKSRTWNGEKKLGRPAKVSASDGSDIGQQPKYRKVRDLEEM